MPLAPAPPEALRKVPPLSPARAPPPPPAPARARPAFLRAFAGLSRASRQPFPADALSNQTPVTSRAGDQASEKRERSD